LSERASQHRRSHVAIDSAIAYRARRRDRGCPRQWLDLKDENSQCIGRPASTAEDLPYDYLYVVMPMRLA